ncbi:retropepsin-like aspartic protease [Aureispira anguillae]|uniref:Retroviral-like aspartic protease family protein n=1 Tax=Aureispira anguillae TaxID=2864201 RepID=A0A916DWP8_9BACT|nr:retropepsin-like aspartic protease [Aureispira anguillae]BDS14920.1 retroviral-like aspartic protease family protein [Aureispira anguillae]
MRTITLLMLILPSFMVLGQTSLPTLKSTTNRISIKEGTIFHKDSWTVSPKIKWDEFVTTPFKIKKTITFYSDIDSLSFTIKPNQIYDFIILLNDEQTAYTRINTSTDKPPSISIKKVLTYYKKLTSGKATPDSIPFKIGADNRIHILGKINQSDSLDLIFDTGANAIVINRSLINKRVNLNLNGQAQNQGSDGISIVATSSNNQLEIGNLIWDEVNILAIDYQDSPFDGVLGWIAFEEKMVEINYELNILVIHPNIASIHPEYTQYPMKMIQGIPYIEGTVVTGNQKATGWFGFDTGCSSSILLSQRFAHEHRFKPILPPISISTHLGSSGIAYQSNDYTLSKFKLGGFETYLIPISINQKDPEGVNNNDILGNLLLKRFNAILDFKNQVIYLKPNQLLHSSYY